LIVPERPTAAVTAIAITPAVVIAVVIGTPAVIAARHPAAIPALRPSAAGHHQAAKNQCGDRLQETSAHRSSSVTDEPAAHVPIASSGVSVTVRMSYTH
jgi:hypothetical protein